MVDNTSIRKISQLQASTYQNSTTVMQIAGVDLKLFELAKVALSARLNIGLLGEAGMGKSQLLADIQGLMGNNASYVLGRNDLDIKSLFRQMDMTPLTQAMKQGGVVAQKDITNVTDEVYKPLVVVEEINRCAEVVQNQFFNIFEGFIELNGKKYSLGGSKLETFRGLSGKEWSRNVRYSVGVWTANFGNGEYSGTVSMDKALKERSHLIIDVDNFKPQPQDLDTILLESGGEVRLKEHDNANDHTALFADAFSYLKQGSYTPNPEELGQELLLFRYLVLGLDYIPCVAADNSKRKMKEVWPAKAEEDDIGSDDEKFLYRMCAPASVRSAMTIMSLARGLREYVKAKNPKAEPKVLESVMASFQFVAPYSGIIRNKQRIREEFVGNSYKAGAKIASVVQTRLEAQEDLMNAIVYCKAEGKALPRKVKQACVGEYECFKG